MHLLIAPAIRRVPLLALLCCALALAPPLTALATPLAGINIVLMRESNRSETPLLGITARLADEAELPAEIVLPVPENPNIIWTGEFFLEEGRENLPAQHQLEVRDGVPALVFTLTESRLGHAEMTYPGSEVLVQAALEVYEVGFDLTLPVETGPVYAAIALPPHYQGLAGSDVVRMSTEADGLTYYHIEQPSGEPGDSVALSIQVQEIDPPGRYNEPVVWMVVIVGLVIVGSAAALAVNRKRAGGVPADEA